MDLETEYRRMQYSHQMTADDLAKAMVELLQSQEVISQIRDLCQDRVSDGFGLIPHEVLEIIECYDVR